MTIFFSSDLHFGHTNILTYANRPFKDVNEMNEKLILNWNSLITPSDTVYVLGDVCMGNLPDTIKYVGRLNGKKTLIAGNHDKKARKKPEFCGYFKAIYDYLEITEDGELFVLSHYPLATWNGAHHGSLHLCGHSHHSYNPSMPTTFDKGKILDVGIDGAGYNYAPLALDRVLAIMSKKNFKSVDHHEL